MIKKEFDYIEDLYKKENQAFDSKTTDVIFDYIQTVRSSSTPDEIIEKTYPEFAENIKQNLESIADEQFIKFVEEVESDPVAQREEYKLKQVPLSFIDSISSKKYVRIPVFLIVVGSIGVLTQYLTSQRIAMIILTAIAGFVPLYYESKD